MSRTHTKKCYRLQELCDEEECEAMMCQNGYCDLVGEVLSGEHTHES